jgi:hypothetical protein
LDLTWKQPFLIFNIKEAYVLYYKPLSSLKLNWEWPRPAPNRDFIETPETKVFQILGQKEAALCSYTYQMFSLQTRTREQLQSERIKSRKNAS